MKFAFGARCAAVLFALIVGFLSASPALATTAYCPPDASHFNACATVETEQALAASAEATPAPYVYTSGYRSAGDSGGKVLYAQIGTFSGGFCNLADTPNGGSVITDNATPTKHCYYAQTFPQNVMQWGAYCDAAQPQMPGAVDPSNAHNFEAPVFIPSTAGTNIVITGASSGSALATTATIGTPVTINSVSASTTSQSNTVSMTPPAALVVGMAVTGMHIPNNTIVTAKGGSSITISNPAGGSGSTSLTFVGTPLTLAAPATTTVPMRVATKVAEGSMRNSRMNMPGDMLTLSDLTVIEVITVDSGNHITDAEIYSQSPVPYQSSQVTDSYGGNYSLTYASNNQFWYGHDDSAAINTALAQTPGADIWLPPDKTCGVAPSSGTVGVTLAAGANSLRGWGENSSGLVALSSGLTYVMARTSANTGAAGGGARDLFVEGNTLATNTCGVQGGQDQVYENVNCLDGASAGTEWLYGGPDAQSQLANNLFIHIKGDYSYINFPFLTSRSSSHINWSVGIYGTWASIIGSNFHSGATGIEEASQDFWNAYTDDVVTGSQPFNPNYCAVLSARKHLTNFECDNPKIAAVHITGNYVDVEGVNTQWIHSLSGTACNVQIDSSTDYEYVSGVQSVPTPTPSANFFPSNLVICQTGNLGSNDVIVGNPNASLSVLGAATVTPRPQGRLTLQLNSPVMTSDAVGVSTIWYAPYAGNQVPIFNGSSVQEYAFTSGVNPMH